VIHLKKSILLSSTVTVLLFRLICNVILFHDFTIASYYDFLEKKDNNVQTFENKRLIDYSLIELIDEINISKNLCSR